MESAEVQGVSLADVQVEAVAVLGSQLHVVDAEPELLELHAPGIAGA